MIYVLRDGYVAGTSLVCGESCGLPFLMDLGGDYLAMTYYDAVDATLAIRKMDKRTGQWGQPSHPFPPFADHKYGWHGRYSPIAINFEPGTSLEPSTSGGYDRILYLFWGYSYYAWYMDEVEDRWMMTAIENLGPDGN